MDVLNGAFGFHFVSPPEAAQFFKQVGFHTVTVHQPTLAFNSTQSDTSNLDQAGSLRRLGLVDT